MDHNFFERKHAVTRRKNIIGFGVMAKQSERGPPRPLLHFMVGKR